jgi:hypothetical protein
MEAGVFFCGTIPWSWIALLDTNYNHVEDREFALVLLMPFTLHSAVYQMIDTVMNNLIYQPCRSTSPGHTTISTFCTLKPHRVLQRCGVAAVGRADLHWSSNVLNPASPRACYPHPCVMCRYTMPRSTHAFAISAARISESYQKRSGALLRALCSGSQGSGFGGVHHLLVAGSAHLHAGRVTNGIDDT